jgi:hypothetical protein
MDLPRGDPRSTTRFPTRLDHLPRHSQHRDVGDDTRTPRRLACYGTRTLPSRNDIHHRTPGAVDDNTHTTLRGRPHTCSAPGHNVASRNRNAASDPATTQTTAPSAPD